MDLPERTVRYRPSTSHWCEPCEAFTPAPCRAQWHTAPSLLDGLTPGPFRTPQTHDEWVDALRDQYEGTGIGVLDDGTLIRLSTGAPV